MTYQTVNEALAALDLQSFCKIVISKPLSAGAAFQKIRLERRGDCYQAEKYTKTQVFHQQVQPDTLRDFCCSIMAGSYGQFNAQSETGEAVDMLVSGKGKVTLKTHRQSQPVTVRQEHDRRKNYLLPEGTIIPPLIDMGIFTAEGKIVRTMYDKYRQINRFIEIMDDACGTLTGDTVRMIDFGCGKSYLTFIVYYYFTEIRKKSVEIIGLDLKKEVIEHCNQAAAKYGYQGLSFRVGDINGFDCPFDVDIVMTLHACDTATDFALYNAVKWNAKMIFSVPCCQHEVNGQIHSQELSLLTRYGIIQERFSALMTDAIRANLLEYQGYKTQVLEFVDLSHTPKNLLIRAVRRPVMPAKAREAYLQEAQRAMEEFHVKPTLYRLLVEEA